MIVICSFQFAGRHAEDLMFQRWDMAMIDEAHRLRNVYRVDNKIGKALKGALSNAPKVLLAATPLQNSLMELYGLVSIIYDYAFGDPMDPLVGKSGTLSVQKLTATGADAQDHIILAGITDDGTRIDQKAAMRLFDLPSKKTADRGN